VATTTPIARHPTSSAEYVAGEIKKNKKKVLAVAVIVLVVGLAVLGIGGAIAYRYYGSNGSSASKPPGAANLKMTPDVQRQD
jgi:hypothetical protein